MTTPESRLPVDTSVQIPASVRASTAAAEAAYKAAYGEPAPDATAPPETPPAPAAEATPPAPPAEPPAPPPPPAEPVTAAEWEHRYNSMKGRFDQASQTNGMLQEQMREMGDELTRVHATITQRQQAPRQDPPPPRKLVTQADMDTYGPELIDVIRRAAVEAVAPELQSQRQEIRKTGQRVASTTVHSALGAQIPNWEEINSSPRFLDWLRKPDVYSGQLRSAMLTAAFQAADAPRVLAFFKGFQTEEATTGHAPPAQQSSEPETPRVAAVPLESLAAPGKARPASDIQPQGPDAKPVFTRAQVASFYDQVRKGLYAGREADKAKAEQAIVAAGREGRIR